MVHQTICVFCQFYFLTPGFSFTFDSRKMYYPIYHHYKKLFFCSAKIYIHFGSWPKLEINHAMLCLNYWSSLNQCPHILRLGSSHLPIKYYFTMNQNLFNVLWSFYMTIFGLSTYIRVKLQRQCQVHFQPCLILICTYCICWTLFARQHSKIVKGKLYHSLF